jgi:hypothetical protein
VLKSCIFFQNVPLHELRCTVSTTTTRLHGKAHPSTVALQVCTRRPRTSSPAAEGMPVPDNVDMNALDNFLDWDAEAQRTRDGAAAGIGWTPEAYGLHPAVAAATLGVASWRLGRMMDPQLITIASNIECFWRELFPGDLSPMDMDPRWKLLDSCDPNQTGDVAWGSQDPERGSKQFPRLILENRCYQSRVFRNLHMELVWRQDGFQVRACRGFRYPEHPLCCCGQSARACATCTRCAVALASCVEAGSSSWFQGSRRCRHPLSGSAWTMTLSSTHAPTPCGRMMH